MVNKKNSKKVLGMTHRGPPFVEIVPQGYCFNTLFSLSVPCYWANGHTKVKKALVMYFTWSLPVTLLRVYDATPRGGILLREEPLMIWGGGLGQKREKKNSTATRPGKIKLKKNSTAGWPGKKISTRILCPSAPPDN